MNDFASATMVRILAAGMLREGLRPPPLPQTGARVPLAFKRELLQSAVTQGGLTVLPRLGRGLHDLPGSPVQQALAVSTSPSELVERWRRMERYIHSRHRIDVESAQGTSEYGALALCHSSLQAQQPLAPESLVVLGVIAAACETIGAQNVQVHVGEIPLYPHTAPDALARLVAQRKTGRWIMRWQGMALTPHSLFQGPVLPVTDRDEPTVRALRHLLLADLVAPPALADASVRLGRSSRSLQRHLAAQDTSYSDLLAQTRCLAAAWYLVHTPHSTAETGFMCGFSDQPHFTRTFTQRVGVPPARYRKDFERSPPGTTVWNA